MVVLVIFYHNLVFCYFFVFYLTVFRVTGSEYKYKNGIFSF